MQVNNEAIGIAYGHKKYNRDADTLKGETIFDIVIP